MDLGAALIGLVIALGVKLFVMVLGARLLLRVYQASSAHPPRRLWLLLPEENRPEIRILWWSLVLFCLSEFTCGIEVYIIFRSHPVLTGTHSLTSGLGMSLFALGIYLYLDRELLRYGQPSCLVNRICRGCTIRKDAGCRFHHVVVFAGTFVALAAILPMFAPVEVLVADTSRYRLPFPALNAWYDGTVIPWLESVYPDYDPSGSAYHLPESMSVIEFRIYPAVALLLAAAGTWTAHRRREEAGTKLVVLATGLLCYTYFELALYRATGDVLLGSLGHEVAELWFLLVTAEFLRRCFPADRGVAILETQE